MEKEIAVLFEKYREFLAAMAQDHPEMEQPVTLSLKEFERRWKKADPTMRERWTKRYVDGYEAAKATLKASLCELPPPFESEDA